MKFICGLEQGKTFSELEVTDMTQILIPLYPVECKLKFSFVYLKNNNVHRYDNGTYHTHTHTHTHSFHELPYCTIITSVKNGGYILTLTGALISP